ncbi:hypothetical protein QBC32DRAFT_232396 [Pseudoneurospora amorphoporcata]|uniref:Uncharacterized protein n=1 Tax=Pseudoneurospora amorphoporcata TaxID=241081 RepID=A0AAN6NYI3_9PEZI|nr:hypothetical protein QBC32DRAFT_232396 [Pseudoneurospora amorphoporcata]
MPHQHMHAKSMSGQRQMGQEYHHGNQNPRLNPRAGSSPSDGDSDADDTIAPTAEPTANPTANSPAITQGQTNKPTQASAQEQPTNSGTLSTLPHEGPIVHTNLHTSILHSPASVTVVLGNPDGAEQTTFATQYNGGDTLAIDTQALTFSSGPLPTSAAGASNNLGSGSSSKNGGSTGAANTQASNGGLGAGAIAGIIVGVVLLLVISLVILFFRKRRNSRRNNSPYGKPIQEETRSSLPDTGLAASVAPGAATVGGTTSRHGPSDSSSTAALRSTPPQAQQQQQQQQQPLMHQRHNSEFGLPTGSSHTAPRPAPPPPTASKSNHSTNTNPIRSRLSVSIISGPPPPTHISSAFAPTAVSPISPVSPAAVIGRPPCSPPPQDGGSGGLGLGLGLGGRTNSIGSVSTLSIHSTMMSASQLNWPMPPSVASTSSPCVPLTATPSASARGRPAAPSPHYVDFEEQGRTVVRINRESLSGGGIGSAR